MTAAVAAAPNTVMTNGRAELRSGAAAAVTMARRLQHSEPTSRYAGRSWRDDAPSRRGGDARSAVRPHRADGRDDGSRPARPRPEPRPRDGARVSAPRRGDDAARAGRPAQGHAAQRDGADRRARAERARRPRTASQRQAG